ncbi:MAG: GNAT family N-acetyltransferase [Candidatus Thorarchaeota archaeon]
MTNFIYRHYRKGDEEDLADLFNRAFQQGGAGFVRTPKSWYWRYVQSPGFDPEMCQIAEDPTTNKIIGAVYSNLIEIIPLDGKKYLVGDINDVSCHPDYVKQGVATSLMKNAIKYMQKRGCSFSILSANYKGFPMRKIYERLGYHVFRKELRFIQFPCIMRLIRDVWGLAIFIPLLFTLSYLPRYLNRIKLRLSHTLKDFTYEINYNCKHLEYIKAVNHIISKYYEGYAKSNTSKLRWARIKVPCKRFRPTYILIKKGERIIGGAVMTHQNIYFFKYGIKIRIGLIHEIFLDKDKFNNKEDLYLGYTYLIDKIMRATTRRHLGVLLFKTTLGDTDLIEALRRSSFLKIQDTGAMVKELKNDVKFHDIKKPLFIPTYVTLGFP